MIRNRKGVTLAELLVALAVSSILMLGVIAAFQTTQRTAAVGEARDQIYQNARVALDLMAKEIKGAYIDNRNRDLMLISADGMAGKGNSILQTGPTVRGLGNAQTPHGIYTSAVSGVNYSFTAEDFYADKTYTDPTFSNNLTDTTIRSIKALDQNLYPAPGLPPGPPDRLDFTCMTNNFPNNTNNDTRLAEVRYLITTESFDDDLDNDEDGVVDSADSNPPNLGAITGLGDMIAMDPSRRNSISQSRDEEYFHPETGRIMDLALFQLRRSVDTTPDKNGFSDNNMATGNGTYTDPQGRYPARDFADFSMGSGIGENIGSYIYDLQFEFYGRIALSLDSTGAPNTWGVGWGYQDVRGEDMGTIDDNANDDGELALVIDFGTVDTNLDIDATDDDGDTVNDDFDGPYALPEIDQTNGTDDDGDGVNDDGPLDDEGQAESQYIFGTGTTWASFLDAATNPVSLVGGIFFILPTGSTETTEFDVAASENNVYTIIEVINDTTLVLDRPYEGAHVTGAPYRIIEPNQANGVLDTGEDEGSDGLNGDYLDENTGIPNNISDNDNDQTEISIGEGNGRLDSRVMGVWDSRSPDPRNPRRAAELDGVDSDSDAAALQVDGIDNDQDGQSDANDDDASDASASPEADDPAGATADVDETNDLIDDDDGNGTPGDDGIADDRFYDPAGRPEGVDEPDEADPDDDTLPKAVRITIVASDSMQSIDPIVLSTTVWLSTAR